MSEYQERHSVSRLIGAPPGYIGYDEGDSSLRQYVINHILLFFSTKLKKHIPTCLIFFFRFLMKVGLQTIRDGL